MRALARGGVGDGASGLVGSTTEGMPRQMRPEYDKLLRGDSEVEDLVRAADKLSAYIKCLEELKSGNEEFRLAARSTLAKLRDMNMPEVEYFLENFVPAFEKTLDELGL